MFWQLRQREGFICAGGGGGWFPCSEEWLDEERTGRAGGVS